jgi:hypothetical protein
MKMRIRRTAPLFQRGSVAVEAAVIMTFVLVPLLAFTLFLGRYFWYYSVAQKASHDAALYYSHAPLHEINKVLSPGLLMASANTTDEAADITSPTDVELFVQCKYPGPPGSDFWTGCNNTLSRPLSVKADVTFSMNDPFFSVMTWTITGGQPLAIFASTTVTYAGR